MDSLNCTLVNPNSSQPNPNDKREHLKCGINCLADCEKCRPPTAECLHGRLKEVQGVLRRKGYSENAIDHAVTVVYGAAMPYIKGTKVCTIENRRAWVFKVAIRAASRAAKREVRCHTVEPAVLAATLINPEPAEELFDIRDALKQLTEKQIAAVEHCILKEMSFVFTVTLSYEMSAQRGLG